MSTATKYQLYTFEEFCALIPEGQKADLIDGVIYMASPDNIEHYHINRWLSRLIEDYLDASMIEGDVFGYKIAFRLGPTGGPEPDLGYVQGSRLHLVKTTYVDGPPDLAIEIVSPDSIERDYKKKHKQYEEASVGEYWIIDPMKEKMTCFVLSGKGKFKQVRARGGKIHCQIIPGFWVRPGWFWQAPLPKKNEVLAEILKGKKHGQ
jgi:Uma2 family endonuclease